MKKKIISAIFSAFIASLNLSQLNVSALAPVYTTVGSDSYNNMTAKLNENLIHATELVEDAFPLISYADWNKGEVADLWIGDKSGYNFNTRLCTVLFADHDTLCVSIEEAIADPEILPDILDEFRKELGYSDRIFNIKDGSEYGVTGNIKIQFSGNDHELNYMIAQKAVELLKQKYTITAADSSFDRYYLENCTVSVSPSIAVESDGKTYSSEDIEAINSALTNKGIRVQFNTEAEYMESYGSLRYKAEFPSDFTDKELFEYGHFLYENDIQKHFCYFYANVNDSVSANVDFLSVENAWLDGDANEDGEMNIADATAIVQAIGNPDRYALSAQGEFNADSDGNGLTGLDARAIQLKLVSK